MFEGKRILGLITARGGSKGLPRKNIRTVGGKPLIGWTIEAARASTVIDRLILSSEDEEIIRIAKGLGCEVPFIRPAELATDEAGSMDVVRHALGEVGAGYDYVVLLQPTSPARTAQDIDCAVMKCIQSSANSCVGAVELEKNPFWSFSLTEKGHISPLVSFESIPQRRQDCATYYALNGAIYVGSCSYLRSGGDFFTQEAVVWIMTKARSVDIDTEDDLRLFECMLEKG